MMDSFALQGCSDFLNLTGARANSAGQRSLSCVCHFCRGRAQGPVTGIIQFPLCLLNTSASPHSGLTHPFLPAGAWPGWWRNRNAIRCSITKRLVSFLPSTAQSPFPQKGPPGTPFQLWSDPVNTRDFHPEGKPELLCLQFYLQKCFSL